MARGKVAEDDEEIKIKKFSMEVSRVFKILRESIKKLEFAMTVPELVKEECFQISPYLTEEEFNFICSTFVTLLQSRMSDISVDYRHTDFFRVQSLSSIELFFNNYESQNQEVAQRDDADFFKGLNILYEKPKIRMLSRAYRRKMSEAAFNFLQDIKFFYYTMMEKMKLTPEQEEAREIRLSKMFHNHQRLSDEAHIMEDEEKDNLQQNIQRLEEIEEKVREISLKIKNLRAYCEESIEKFGQEAEETMKSDWKTSEYRQEVLTEEIAVAEAELEKLRKNFIEEEKELRLKKFKIEQQLVALLRQYDKDMRDRQELWEAQVEFLEAERKQLEELEERYIEQDAEYEALMKEKNDYEERLWQAKLYEIQCAIAARKIQRWFRNYLSFTTLHGYRRRAGGKKGKKKKKT